MCAVGGNRGLSGHSRVTYGMCAGHSTKSELPGDVVRPADFLENLHTATTANEGQLRDRCNLFAGRHLVLLPYSQNEMRISNHRSGEGAAGVNRSKQRGEIVIAGSADRKLDRARSCSTVDGEAGRIGPAIA